VYLFSSNENQLIFPNCPVEQRTLRSYGREQGG
jgi:hypothetical protein